MNKTGIIIQARRNSTRLKDKIILPFYKEDTILDIVIKNCKKVMDANRIVLATSTNISDKILKNYSKKYGIKFFMGDENNVVKRFVDSARCFDMSDIIRVCSDNPFLLSNRLKTLIDFNNINHNDYISFKNYDGIPAIKTHLGLYAERVTLQSLINIQNKTNENLYLEHVTNYLYENRDIFKVLLFDVDKTVYERNDLRFTCDTKEDFSMLKSVYKEVIDRVGSMEITVEDLVDIASSNEKYLSIMKKNINKFQK